MRHIKQTVAATLLLLFVGCASVQTGADKFIVRSQQMIQSSFVTVNSFLSLEFSNRALAQTIDPTITRVADELRGTYPAANRSAWIVLDTYRSNRTPENKANVNTILATLNEAVLQAQYNLMKLQASASPLK